MPEITRFYGIIIKMVFAGNNIIRRIFMQYMENMLENLTLEH